MTPMEQIDQLHKTARASFTPTDLHHEYVQALSVCYQYRNGYGPRKGSIGRKVLRMWIERTRSLRIANEAMETLKASVDFLK